jgi:hypothetical protein
MNQEWIEKMANCTSDDFEKNIAMKVEQLTDLVDEWLTSSISDNFEKEVKP